MGQVQEFVSEKVFLSLDQAKPSKRDFNPMGSKKFTEEGNLLATAAAL